MSSFWWDGLLGGVALRSAISPDRPVGITWNTAVVAAHLKRIGEARVDMSGGLPVL